MPGILTVNGGSSSVKFALFAGRSVPQRVLTGKVDRAGGAQATLTAGVVGQRPVQQSIGGHPGGAIGAIADWLKERSEAEQLDAIGHRIVHGMQHRQPARVTAELIEALKKISRIDPEHLPGELELIDQLSARYPAVPQVLCFDTAFHEWLPRVATLLPIPRRYYEAGIQRYGFHGLSYTYLLEELRRLDEASASHGRVLLAHLGSGASMAAVRDGRCIDTTMGFTPTGGLVMGTRSGDLDPGLVTYLARDVDGDVKKLSRLLNHESGLLGMSERSGDVRDLLERESSDPHAREALEVFCQQARKWVGALTAVLGGLDTLVFAGGIGENSPEIRARICAGLGFLGIEIDGPRNAGKDPDVISMPGSRVHIRVIKTDEESVIAAQTMRALALDKS